MKGRGEKKREAEKNVELNKINKKETLPNMRFHDMCQNIECPEKVFMLKG